MTKYILALTSICLAIILVFLFFRQDSPKQVIGKYIECTTWKERMSLCVDSDGLLKERMSKWYDKDVINVKSSQKTIYEVEYVDSDKQLCSVSVDNGLNAGISQYYLKLIGGKWKVLWEPSVGYNEYPLGSYAILNKLEKTLVYVYIRGVTDSKEVEKFGPGNSIIMGVQDARGSGFLMPLQNLQISSKEVLSKLKDDLLDGKEHKYIIEIQVIDGSRNVIISSIQSRNSWYFIE